MNIFRGCWKAGAVNRTERGASGPDRPTSNISLLHCLHRSLVRHGNRESGVPDPPSPPLSSPHATVGIHFLRLTFACDSATLGEKLCLLYEMLRFPRTNLSPSPKLGAFSG